MINDTKTTNANTLPTISTGAAVLWASAFILAALVIIQAGRYQGQAAHADSMTADKGTFTVLTARSGRGPTATPHHLLYVIDSRDQTFLVYEVEDARKQRILLRDGYSLDALFREAAR